MRPEDIKIFSHFMEQLRKESDRGLALIGAAFIDKKLAETLQAFFCKDAGDFLYGKNAPLGTFSSRIEACHALALIEDIERNDCDYIRRVRNEFAHDVMAASFEEGRIKDLCGNFKSDVPLPETATSSKARFKFQNAALIMASRLFYRAEYVQREKRTQKVWANPDQFRWRRTDEELPDEGVPVIGIRV